MGLILIPNQSVSFVNTGDLDFNERNKACKFDPIEFCQIVSPADPTQFQVKVTPDTGTELLTNGDFNGNLTSWTSSGGWNYTTSPEQGALFVASSSSPITLTQPAAFAATIGDAYRIIIDICSFDLTFPGDGVFITALDSGGNSAGVITGVGSGSSPITTAGTYTMTFESSVADTIDIVINAVGASGFASGIICSISAMAVTLPEVTIQDCDGNSIDTITDIEYAAEYATVTVDWSSYSEGCYKICIFPEQDTGVNLFDLCITDEFNNPILDLDGDCIEYRI